MKIKIVHGVEFRLPEKYQHRRIVEKKMLAWEREVRGYKDKPMVRREQELLIPIIVDHKTTYYVRESKIFSPKWVEHFKSEDHLIQYIENYKNRLT